MHLPSSPLTNRLLLLLLPSPEYRFIIYPPSIIAAAAVCASIDGMKMAMMDSMGPVQVIQQLTHIEKDFILACRNQIEEALDRQLSSIGSSVPHERDENKENLPDTDTPTYPFQTSF
eukprot:m.17647 g.17647  ORF g.17647 m.17647 type:complete len:117 (+) comp27526_c0_seq1:827-1177(+)